MSRTRTLVSSLAPVVAFAAFASPALAIDTIYGLTSGNGLVRFQSNDTSTVTSATAISGLNMGESLLGIDFRPANGMLYGLGSSGRIFTINTSTAVATPVGSGNISGSLSGSAYGFDFNPVADRIRITTTSGANLRVNPDTGALAATDGMLRFSAGDVNANASPRIVASAYTNSRPGATSTTLYNLDSGLHILTSQIPPNDGFQNTIGGLGFNISDATGFDIASSDGRAFASFNRPGFASTSIYTINLATGAPTFVGDLSGLVVNDIAIAIPSAPTASLLAVAGLASTRRRRAMRTA